MPFAATRLARYELRRFRGPLPRLALIFVVLVPLLYGAIYLTASWDPYGNLDKLQVAVVNEDEPASFEGERIAAGEDLVENLDRNRTFDWQFVDAETADRGLRTGQYYMILTIGPDFSTNLVSGAGDDPQRAVVSLRRDDANGFVIGSITGKAEDTIVRQIDESAQEAYFRAVLGNLAVIRDSLVEARDGAGQLSDGLDTAEKGSSDLADGAKSADQGAQELADGAKQARDASRQLNSGLGELESGAGDLADGAQQVADGTSKLTQGVLPVLDELQKHLPQLESDAKKVSAEAARIADLIAGRTDSLSSDVSALQDLVTSLEKDNPDLADDPNWAALKKRLDQASDRTGEVADRAKQISERIDALDARIQQTQGLAEKVTQAKSDLNQLNDGAHQVADGAKQLHTGLTSAHQGANQLSTGLDTLSSGADELSDGIGELSDGASSLHTGLAQLREGATTLRDGLADGVDRIPVFSASDEDRAVQVLSSPADVDATVDNPADYYGRGLAPMFFAIALWVFGISVFLVVRPITGRTLAGRTSPLRMAFTAWLPIAGLAVLGGLIMVGTVWLTLGLDPVHAPAFLGVTVLGALCFSAIAHFLRTALGTPGSSLLLVWLILQLASAGGTYPGPVLPQFFAAIGPFMPMTYLIDAFRVTISGGWMPHLARDVAILAAITVVTLALTTVVVSGRRRFAMKDLHPPLVAP